MWSHVSVALAGSLGSFEGRLLGAGVLLLAIATVAALLGQTG